MTRRWESWFWPLFALALFLGLWQISVTLSHTRIFPAPLDVQRGLRELIRKGLLWSYIGDSLFRVGMGYLAAVALAIPTGLALGWYPSSARAVNPIIQIMRPISPLAWIPLSMVISPSALISAVALIALAVWFPVTMLTASGISNTRASYLDVARTLGAGRGYLIFRVAVPAALPNIFIGLFMGLGASFLTLVVAETVGVKSGLGWYVSWAQGWAEYGKVFAALIIMAAFFSTIMTALFKVRDRMLVWQKGVIKW